MLLLRDRQYWHQQDAEAEQLQHQLTQNLNESIQRHESVRAYAVQTLENAKRELERVQQEFIARAQLQEFEEAEQARQREAEIRQRQQEAAELQLQEERRIAEDAVKLQRTKEAAEELRRQREEAEQRQRSIDAAAAAAPPASTTQLAQTVGSLSKPNGNVAAQNPFLQATSTQQPQPGVKPPPQAPPAASPGLVSSIQERDHIHQQYLALHKRLKKMRTQVKTAGNEVKEWRNQRMQIKKLLGQLANENGESLTQQERQTVRMANLQRRKEIITILQGAQRAPGPRLDAREFMVNPGSLTNLDSNAAQVPAVFIFLLNMCAKAAINTFKKTAVAVTETVGITVAFVFGSLDLRFHGESFIDILLAKYRFACPILFGIYGPERTEGGRVRLGWPFSVGDDGRRLWIDEKDFFEEQTSLAVGWAALTLRDFKKAKTSSNACPPWNYWKSVSCIVNTPPEQVTRLHFVVLKNLIENHADKFIKFYGQAATVALRTAVVVFPGKQGAKGSTERNGLEFLRDGLRREFGIVL
jgi:nucleoporin GLE1